MKQIKLKRVNSMKFCPNCNEKVKIVMVGQDGYCPNETSKHTGKHLNKLYTIDTRGLDERKL